jgi:hypothetical protein
MKNKHITVNFCKHESKEYQPYERDTNVPEGYYCLDCNKELPIPEPDMMLESKEYYSRPDVIMEKGE